MNENKKIYSFNYGGKEVTLETGRLAKQTDASVLVSCGGTQVLVTVVSAHEMKDGQDFFPLLVEYTEKFYAAGKFLGGFMKREGRPTTGETLNARLIDRPLRPLFPEGYMFETVVSCTVMSYSPEGDPEILAGIGASAALSISDIPFAGPIATCKVGRIDGKFVLNPSHAEWEKSDLEIAVAGSADAILMVEGEAKIVPEKDVLEAIFWGHDQIKGFVEVIAKMQKEVGKKKREFVSAAGNATLMEKVKTDFTSEVRASLSIVDKMERQVATKEIMAKVAKAASENPTAFGLKEGDSFKKEAYKAVDGLLYDMMRADILDEEKRIGGRKLDEVRQIETETNILVQPHGSSLFTRGETQVLSSVTIGGSAGEQMADRITGLSYNKFYLHYNFPPYSVGEARGVRGVGRRELGHGNLAERALKAIMPADFPYTTRVVCEVLESNGSSSMGSVCSGSMALMDAGVNIVAPCAGVAMGLISDGKRFKVLTDILGDEDHLGDMDFKVAGPKDGITAIQMDIKITGLTREIVEAAMTQARAGRLHILGEMDKTISTHRDEFKDNVPKVKTTKIETDKIGMLIGPGGKNIKGLQENFKVTIEIAEDGTVKVLGADAAAINECLTLIDMQINGPKVGSDYEAKVVTIKEYGAFVDIAQGVSGLVHISELADDRVNNVADYVAEGDVIKVRVVEVDRMGRLKLSAKAAGKIEKKA
ncbi:MAG: polyribonucleotide nucleotidyltransferase [Bdellovibrionales bacterium CG12_big_fil_rev_8_21_14_0_65_38_15]|nr:MAG: polyribonucleotide nucleotidyltransferase [Bdellovibrionales bacterium CG22_combo_CG10-13_8_21_14_all_38_13]PIQ55274.1 MAG: polyribonucleotide nucleotidyltransferase [Bdellovibrionales bacterium CG12_big_fil_rev_8_21_14_0_65_38_15]PIR30778.1 MAG: polyribonucleotide nucleotidyltransferase [Bdellovibrionales bacterium CG11_big_fil_rev_8_21_14_0_20_38_13]